MFLDTEMETAMKPVLLGAMAALLFGGVALAASPVTINNAANTHSMVVNADGSINTTPASGSVQTISPLGVTTTQTAKTLTAGGVAETAIVLNASRKVWCVQNSPVATENLTVRVNGTASATAGTIVTPGNQTCNFPGTVDTAAISVFAATTSHPYITTEAQ